MLLRATPALRCFWGTFTWTGKTLFKAGFTGQCERPPGFPFSTFLSIYFSRKTNILIIKKIIMKTGDSKEEKKT